MTATELRSAPVPTNHPLVSIALLSSLLLATSSSGCGDDQPSDQPVLQELVLDAAAPESQRAGLLGRSAISHYETIELLREAADNERVRGLLLVVGPQGSAFARVTELARAADAVRKRDKPIHCHVRTTDNAGYMLLATACDRISMTPAGLLNLVGVRAQAVYAKPLLDRLGVRAEMLQAGRFKGAVDALTETDMPETTRTSLNALLDGLQGELLGALERGRSIDPERGQQLVDAGPYTAHRARQAGLIDDVGFDDEAREHARRAANVTEVERIGQTDRSEIGLSQILKLLSGERATRPDHDHIRLVVLDGTITSGDPSGSSPGAAADRFVPELRALADDDNCRGVVLRIDSPGGSALASDRMWHAVRRVAKRKPTFVSIGDMAASGGYYIASAGTRIFAEDSSLVGSIGVVGGKLSFAGAASKLGVRVVQLTRGKRAGWTLPLADLTDEERVAMRQTIDDAYAIFLRRVRQGRGLTQEQLEPMAEGRIMLAARAREGQLVDERGGLREALKALREELQADDTLRVSPWPGRQGPLSGLLGGGARTPNHVMEDLVQLADPGGRFAALRSWLHQEPAAALPFRLDVQ